MINIHKYSANNPNPDMVISENHKKTRKEETAVK